MVTEEYNHCQAGLSQPTLKSHSCAHCVPETLTLKVPPRDLELLFLRSPRFPKIKQQLLGQGVRTAVRQRTSSYIMTPENRRKSVDRVLYQLSRFAAGLVEMTPQEDATEELAGTTG